MKRIQTQMCVNLSYLEVTSSLSECQYKVLPTYYNNEFWSLLHKLQNMINENHYKGEKPLVNNYLSDLSSFYELCGFFKKCKLARNLWFMHFATFLPV